MVFVKTYPTTEAAQRAQAHQAWLRRLGMHVPRLLERRGAALAFETIEGHHVTPHDLPAVAALLARAHTAAHRADMHRARLDAPFQLPGVGQLSAFISPRIARVKTILDSGAVPAPTLTTQRACDILATSAAEPAAFYKDANPRNFLATTRGVVTLDFDDLTLAPFGYDLAKLLMTTAMTHGPLPPAATARALDAYNRGVPHPCTPERLNDWMEIHHILTAPYLGRHGYTHAWRAPRHAETRNP